jgi:hypothetical protein
LNISSRTLANCTRCQTPSLLRRLIFGSAADGLAIGRISAAEIEGAVIVQIRGLLRQPEVVLGA